MLLSWFKLCDNRCSERCSFLKGVNEISPLLGTFFLQFGADVVQMSTEVILLIFLRIGTAKAMLYLGTLLSFYVTS